METLSGKRIAVVGSGAVGSYYGGMLALAGHDVHFLMRADLETVRAHGLRITSKGQQLHLPKVNAADAAAETLLPPLISPQTALVTLQNGLGNEEFLAARWGAERVVGALCFICLNRVAPGVIHHLDHGSISIGEFRRPVSPRAQALAAAWQAQDVEAQAVDNLAGERWRKLLWNIPFNG